MRRFAYCVLFVAACGSSNPPPGPVAPQTMPPPDASVTDAAVAIDDLARPSSARDLSSQPSSASDLASAPSPAMDLASAPDMTKVVGPPGGSPCNVSCDCPGAAVCYGGRCVASSWANAGHPATVAFSCCDWFKANGTCTSTVGCQQADGKIVNCAGADCTTLSCSDMWACESMGCGAFTCDATTHMCK